MIAIKCDSGHLDIALGLASRLKRENEARYQKKFSVISRTDQQRDEDATGGIGRRYQQPMGGNFNEMSPPNWCKCHSMIWSRKVIVLN